MTKEVMSKKVFAGGNTTKGFYSYYDYMIKEDANRLFILKGGPGVGKSTFMNKIGSEMMEKGYFIEEHYCSSANEALDGIVIPDLKIALVDGTAPHIVDPKNPAAVDEIINLGEYWRVEDIQAKKEEIISTNKEVGKCFARAYKYLKALNAMVQDIIVINKEGKDLYKYNRIQEELLNNIFKDKVGQRKIAEERHLFGSAITPNGMVDYLETVVGVMKNIYYVKGEWGTGGSELLEEVAKKAYALGYDVEIYHTPLAPEMFVDVLIPELNLALTTNVKFEDGYSHKIDLDAIINQDILKKYQEELRFDKKIYQQLLEESIHYINKAKVTHDKLESFYIMNMDFNRIDEKRVEIVNRILEYENK